MVIVRNSDGNGQATSNKIEKHPYIMVVDCVEGMVLILRHAVELDEEEYSTNDSSVEKSSLARKIIRLLHKPSLMGEEAATSITPLTPRQTEILKQIAKGHPNKWIARTLGISEQTVKNHVASIMDKLDANGRTHAVVLAMLNGWLNIEDVSEIRSEQELAPSLVKS